jgi:hypothetical protein
MDIPIYSRRMQLAESIRNMQKMKCEKFFFTNRLGKESEAENIIKINLTAFRIKLLV